MTLPREKKITCSLIIATYNWPEALRLSLKSALDQSHPPDEIIIADDGSRQETKDLIEEFTNQSLVPIVHIWHPDEGFRLAGIRNKAIKAAKYDYIIQTDGDVILHRNFIFDHLKFAQKDAFLCGSRVSLAPGTSKQLLAKSVFTGLSTSDIPLAAMLNSLRIPWLSTYLADRYKKKKLYVLRGCNMSFWRSDLFKVNGYNEDITGWGSEDFELAMRLINSSVRKRFLKFGGIVYHIYHKENSREKLKQNEEILRKTIADKNTWTDHGITRTKQTGSNV